MPKAALYARYSSDLQNPRSIEDQWRVCRELAAREGWEIVADYHDGAVSGASIRGRAGMERLLADARARLGCSFARPSCQIRASSSAGARDNDRLPGLGS